MKNNIRLALIGLFTFACSSAFAQGRPALSIGAELGIPVGDLNATQKIGLGGSLKAAFPVFEGGAFTISGGIIRFSGDEYRGPSDLIIKRPALNLIPIKAGLKYMVSPSGFYMEPQLGYTVINNPGANTSASGGFTYAYNIGYMLSRQLDVAARYEGLSRNGSNLNHIGFRLGYNFGL